MTSPGGSGREHSDHDSGGTSGDGVVVLGKIIGPHGVRGWLKVRSYTRPPDNLLGYRTWLVGHDGAWQCREVQGGERCGGEFRVKLDGIDDRDRARALSGHEVGVRRSELPVPAAGQYYWVDLIGLEAFSAEGESLGRVDHIRDAPAHPLMVLRGERQRLVPFVRERLLAVDIAAGRITLDWEPDW